MFADIEFTDGSVVNDFEREDAETLYEEDEHQDDAWRADFANWDKVQKSVQRVFRVWERPDVR